MPAAYWKLIVDQGETLRVLLTLRNPPATPGGPPGAVMDLTGYSARMQIRESLTSPIPILSLATPPGSGITINGPAGAITIAIADETTSAWTWRYALYDLEIESPSGETTRLIKGEVEVSPEVTR